MKKHLKPVLVLMLLAIFHEMRADSKGEKDSVVLNRVFNYSALVDTSEVKFATNVYVKYHHFTNRRNFTLYCVPTLYAVAKGKRHYFGESYSHIDFEDATHHKETRNVHVTNVPHHRTTLRNVLTYLTPRIYNVTMVDNYLLSPFCHENRIFYHYKVGKVGDGSARVSFRPKLNNTQMVRGWAMVDENTGRIIKTEMHGEYDMMHFTLCVRPGESGLFSLGPEELDMDLRFVFLGNKLTSSFHAVYHLPTTLPDSIAGSHDKNLMAQLRPAPLTEEEQKLLADQKKNVERDTSQTSRKKGANLAKRVLWDAIGDNLVNRIRGKFGSNEQGYYRISPIFNPLYFGYSGKKGLYYRMNVRAGFNFNENRTLTAQVKGGYSLKQDQVYFRSPIVFTYDKRRNAYVKFEIANGDHISNAQMTDRLKDTFGEEFVDENGDISFFKDTHLLLTHHQNMNPKFSLQAGISYHRREALYKQEFKKANLPITYHTVAPIIEAQYVPFGWTGPVFTANYEVGVKHLLHGDSEYRRWELDASYIHRMKSLRSISARLGGGFYTSKSSETSFLDYTNFREDNIPGGWNDEWSGSFELLKSKWYNSSNYYIRSNLTYESPLLLLSWLPLVGRFLETERFYASTLWVRELNPYSELGYSFTNRVFSLAAFVSMRNGHYNGFGCRLGFELFSHW